MVDSLQLTFVQSSKSCDTITRKNIKKPARSNLDNGPHLRISGQLPALVVKGGDSI